MRRKKEGYKMNLGMTMELSLEMELGPDYSRGTDGVSFGRPCGQCEVECACGSPCGCLFETGDSSLEVNASLGSDAVIQEVA